MKSQERNYIADIERYFLGLAGKGLMLSARDYGFIRELGERSVSKEMVIKAIAYGFEQKRQRGAQEPRGLFNIRHEIEDYLRTQSVEREPKQATPRNAAFTRSNIIEQVLKRLDRVIVEEKERIYGGNTRNSGAGLERRTARGPLTYTNSLICCGGILWGMFSQVFPPRGKSR